MAKETGGKFIGFVSRDNDVNPRFVGILQSLTINRNWRTEPCPLENGLDKISVFLIKAANCTRTAMLGTLEILGQFDLWGHEDASLKLTIVPKRNKYSLNFGVQTRCATCLIRNHDTASAFDNEPGPY